MKRKLEEIPPVNYEDSLKTRALQLSRLIKSKQNLKKAGKIRIVPHKNTLQFYLITKKNDTSGKYLPRQQDDFARTLIQYDYDEKILKSAQKEYKAIEKLLEHNKKSGIEKIFQRFTKHRRSMIEPVTLSEEDFSAKWKNHKHPRKDFINSPEFITANGERVRSKSEVIIADTLSRMNIPYKYEVPLELKNGYIIHPDFCCLNLRTREEIFWEHFGLMDDPDYVVKTINKIQGMQESGYRLGSNFIFTMEHSSHPLNPRFVKSLAENFLV